MCTYLKLDGYRVVRLLLGVVHRSTLVEATSSLTTNGAYTTAVRASDTDNPREHDECA